ncbi:C4-type zinc ribbon domain-containing protein [Opitutales bacterium]|nr:C4-type zinc ribbon domain-containing protein [Opitutales bacterium]
MLSNDTDFQELLLLHGRDRRHGKLIEEKKLLPDDLVRMDQKIKIEQDSIDLAVLEWKELEANNNSLEKELLQISDKIAKNKNKQLEVKKNEEYKALENEIGVLIEQQSAKEDEQIEILLKIDDASATAKVAQEKIALKVVDLERQRANFEKRIQQVESEIVAIEQEIQEARSKVLTDMLRAYDRVKKIVSSAPYLAPLNDQKCSGCNLRVSNDVISTVLVEQKLTQCDQCGRIVYVER